MDIKHTDDNTERITGCFLRLHSSVSPHQFKHTQSAILSIRTGVLIAIYAGIFLAGLTLSELFVNTKLLSLSLSPIIVFQLVKLLDGLA